MLREQVPSLRGRGFALRTAFPNRLYEDHAESLAAAGLVPNAVMMVRCHELCETPGSESCLRHGLLSSANAQTFLRSVNSLAPNVLSAVPNRRPFFSNRAR